MQLATQSQDALQEEGTFEEETMMMMMTHLLISGTKLLLHLAHATTRNPTTEDSRNSSLSLTLHPPVASMQPRTASLLTVNHPVTLAVATVGNGEMVSFLDMHITCALHQHNFVARIILVHFVILSYFKFIPALHWCGILLSFAVHCML